MNPSSVTSAKKIHQNSIIGQLGINLIEKIVLDMGFVWYPSGMLEAGIDGIIEIRDPATGVVFNSIIQVQSKATQGNFKSETVDSFEYVCDARDLAYWLQGNAPVILVVSRPSTEEAYWVSIKDYFNDSRKRENRKVRFDKKRDRFDRACRNDLSRLAVPKDSGIYIAPPPKPERLYSNLLSVTSFANHLYIAETGYRSDKLLLAELRKLGGQFGYEWILHEKRIMSLRNLDGYPWEKVCDLGTLEHFDTQEWAYSADPDKQRSFVQLLNRVLREKVWPAMKYDDRKECYYFRATKDLSDLSVSYTTTSGRIEERTVFKGYPSKSDPTKIAYYRHSAFNGQFKLYEDCWYLEITPTYHFTWDGQHRDKWYEGRLKGIKKLERHLAVFGQLIMWADYLSRPGDMFTPTYPFLEFGSLRQFDIEVGIDDEMWLQSEPTEDTEAAHASINELPLFDGL